MENNTLYELEDELQQEYAESSEPWSAIFINGTQLSIDSKYIPGLKTIDISN